MTKRILAMILALLLLFTCGVSAVGLTVQEPENILEGELQTPSVNSEEKSLARLNYESLLEGDYSGSEMKKQFEELFGSNYSKEYIWEYCAEIFDTPRDQIDEGLLELITYQEPDAESLSLQSTLQGSFHLYEQEEELPPEYDIEQAEVDESPELDFADDLAFTEALENDDVNVLELSGDAAALEVYGPEVIRAEEGIFLLSNSANNGYTGNTYVSRTSTSLTFDAWYKTNNINNRIRYYDYYTGAWNDFVRPNATTGRYTLPGLSLGTYYKVRVAAKVSDVWYYADVIMQTAGAKTPSITLLNQTPTSVTVKVQFPGEYNYGNRVESWRDYDTEWTDVNGAGYYSQSGSYTVTGLYPGAKYTFRARYQDKITGAWADVRAEHQMLPAEALTTYTQSNMIFRLDQSAIGILGSARSGRFVSKTNNGYSIIWDLVGGSKPYSGAKMEFENTRALPENTEGRSGQPIQWKTQTAVYHCIQMANLNSDLTETPFHEISHNFDSYKWVFEAEALAIFKIYHYLDVSGEAMAVCNYGQLINGGNGFMAYMKSDANRVSGHINYDASIPQGIYSPYGLAYNLAKIKTQIGWEPFKQTFRYFHNLSSGDVPTTSIGKFNLFMTKLRDYSGQDVLTMFTSQEKTVYQAKLGGAMQYVSTVNLPNNTSLVWPTSSGEVTLWFGKPDEQFGTNEKHKGMNIQGATNASVNSIGAGVVSAIERNTSNFKNVVYVDFKLNNVMMQVRYGNLSSIKTGLSVGQSVTKGSNIGQMGLSSNIAATKSVVEIVLLRNSEFVDPISYLPRPNVTNDQYLSNPMAVVFDGSGLLTTALMQSTSVQFESIVTLAANSENDRYLKNLDLAVDDEVYLRKIVVEVARNYDETITNENVESRGVLSYNEQLHQATVTISGQTETYNSTNAKTTNSRFVVSISEFCTDFSGKAIVIIPGTLGSTLRNTDSFNGTGHDVWLDLGYYNQMELNEDGTNKFPVSAEKHDNYGVNHTYKKLYSGLKDAFGSYYDVIFFDYDWRMSTEFAAEQLSLALENYQQVILVGHSMGGLVASKFLAIDSNNREKTVALITLGTPYFGSAKCLNVMDTGEMILSPLSNNDYIFKEIIKKVSRNSFGAYQLLPTEKYYSYTGFYPYSVANANYTNYTAIGGLQNAAWAKTAQLNTAKAFHSSLWSGNAHVTNWGGVSTYKIIGSNQDTIATVKYDANYNVIDTIEKPGDGTVLIQSAGFENTYIAYSGIDHTELAKDSKVIDKIKYIITSKTGVVATSSAIPQSISLAEEVDIDQLIFNQRGWINGEDNRRINIFVSDDATLSMNGSTVFEKGEYLYTEHDVKIGNVWQLGDSGRKKYILRNVDNDFNIIVTGQVKIEFMDSGYYNKVIEYESVGPAVFSIKNDSVTGLQCEVPETSKGLNYSRNGDVIMPAKNYTDSELMVLNQD